MTLHEWNGDMHLSSFDRQMWSLYNDIVLRFNTMPILKINHPYTIWYIYRDCTYYYEVVKYLKQELASEIEGDFHNIVIAPYDGQEPYVQKEQMDAIVKEAMSGFMSKIKKRQKEQEKRQKEQDDRG